MTPTEANVNQEALIERFTGLKDDNIEIKAALSCLTREVSDFRLIYTSGHERVVMQSDASHRRLDDHEDRLKKIESILPSLVMTGKALTFVGSAMVLAIIGLIWALITGQAVVITV